MAETLTSGMAWGCPLCRVTVRVQHFFFSLSFCGLNERV